MQQIATESILKAYHNHAFLMQATIIISYQLIHIELEQENN